jgi:hypothetical protein
MAIDQENIEDALMICHEDITLFLFQILLSFNLYWQQESLENDFSPPMAWNITPEMAVADGCANTYLQSCDNRPQHQYGKSNKYLINFI